SPTSEDITPPRRSGGAGARALPRRRSAASGPLLPELRDRGIGPAVTQVWASSGLLAGMPDVCNAVCVGHLLYGLSTVNADVADASELRPLLTAIKSRLIHVAHRAASGDSAASGPYATRNAPVTGVGPLGLGDGMRHPP